MACLSSGSVSVVAVADMYGVSGRRAELAEALRAGERAATGRAGCVRYAFAVRLDDADHYVLLARPSEMVIYAVDGAARPVASRPMDPRDAD